MTNETVGNYAFNKARLFAKQTSQQLLWVQAEDYLDDPHFAELTQEQKKDKNGSLQSSTCDAQAAFQHCCPCVMTYHFESCTATTEDNQPN